MPVALLGPEPVFPPADSAEPSGLVAVGGDLRPERLLAGYAAGIFPWYEEPPILWFSPDPRAVLLPERLHVPRRLERTLRQGRFQVRFDAAFAEVIRSCATVRRRGARGTWITPEMIDAYVELHRLGHAHSAEAWRDGRLVGGIYGVALGRVFFAESMFHRERDASKVALVVGVRRLASCGFSLVDCQLPTAHLARLGASTLPRARFLRLLAAASTEGTAPLR